MTETPQRSILLIGTLLLAGIFYNAPLAFLNAHVTSISTMHVMAVEALILAVIAVVSYPVRTKLMTPWMLYSFGFILIFILIGLVNALLGQTVSPKPLRDVFLITAFGILGICYAQSKGNIAPLIRLVAILVTVFIFIENYATEVYTWLFNIADYYVSTRGFSSDDNLYIEQSGGLFVNTQLIEGRFSLGFLSTHRLSSLFLEQTSLANFAILMAIATSVFWDKLGKLDKYFFPAAALLAVIATDSRMAFGVVMLIIIMHFAARYMPNRINLLYMPIFLFLAYLMFYDPRNITFLSDDLPGRFTWSLTQMSWITWSGALGGAMYKTALSMDSGYSYIIYSQSIFGLLLLWLFSNLIIPQNTASSKKFAHMLAIFMCINLMVGPTMLSIKAAAFLWFMAGYIYYQSKTDTAQQPTSN